MSSEGSADRLNYSHWPFRLIRKQWWSIQLVFSLFRCDFRRDIGRIQFVTQTHTPANILDFHVNGLADVYGVGVLFFL